ncbi:MAG: hypothetical protein PsegKO_35680 [Pseudohongiellaceae bacterium]|jgi:hypothetical protein
MSQDEMNKHPDNGDSQCYFMQLQIDSFLDGELSSEQQKIFAGHLHGCSDCAAELQFAQTLHDTVMDLPLLDCADGALEPIDRLGRESGKLDAARAGWLHSLASWLTALPATLRYGAPVAAAVAITLLLSPVLNNGSEAPPAVATTADNGEQEYSQEDVLAALGDLNTAISYLNEVSQRTETMIGGRFVLVPLQESLNASFQRVSNQDDDPLSDDPI